MRIAPTTFLILTLAMPVAAQTMDNPLVVQVGVFNVRQDGALGGYAVDVGERINEPFASLVWTGNGGCRIGAVDLERVEKRDPPEGETDAWEVRGRVLTMNAEHAEVQVEWRRLRASGAVVDGAWSQRQVTVALNELLSFDAPIAATGQCAPQSVAFGARFAPRFTRPVNLVASGGGGSVPSSGTGTSNGSRGAGRVSARPAVPPYDAEMWLVHSVPGKADSSMPLKIRLDGGLAPFAFSPVRFAVAGGTLSVELKGSLRLVRSEESGLTYILTGTRAVTFSPATRPGRDPGDPRHERASFITTKPVPGVDDVIAYDMPELSIPDGGAVPDKLTVRLRLRPAVAGN
jgi:hypothetical protein